MALGPDDTVQRPDQGRKSLVGGPWVLSVCSRSRGHTFPRDLRPKIFGVQCLRLLRPAGADPQKAETVELLPEICLLEAFPRHRVVSRREPADAHGTLVTDARRLGHRGPRARMAVAAGHA